MSGAFTPPAHATRVAAAFDAVADSYDEVWTHGFVGRRQRQQVWEEIRHTFRPGDRVLELGCGTGLDAAHLAGRGMRIHATDASPEMLRRAKARIAEAGLSERVSFELRLIEDLAAIGETGPFDGIYSNFGALNCVEDPAAASGALARLVRPGGKLVLCTLGRFCLWEAAWFLSQGQFRKGLRRLSGKARVSLESSRSFQLQYHSIAHLKRALAGYFDLVAFRGIGVFVPPSYVEHWAGRHPALLNIFAALDRRTGHLPLLRACADHRLVFFERGGSR